MIMPDEKADIIVKISIDFLANQSKPLPLSQGVPDPAAFVLADWW